MTRPTEKIVAFHSGAPPLTNSAAAARGADARHRYRRAGARRPAWRPPRRRAALDRALRERLAALAPLLDARRAGGRFVAATAISPLRNICLFEGRTDAVRLHQNSTTASA